MRSISRASSEFTLKDDLENMRAFVVTVLRGDPLTVVPPPALIRVNHLGPIAYRLGVQEFRSEYAASLIMAERRGAMIRELAKELTARGLGLALIKGIALVGVIYPDPAERPMHDIDVLVPAADLAEAIECVKQLGFMRVGFSRKLSRWYHAIVFLRGDMMVELHRNIVQPYRTGIRIEEMWQRAVRDPLGSGAQRLDQIDELLICLVHMARHELAVPAVNYVDVSRMWKRLDGHQRDMMWSRARAYRVERAVRVVLQMTEMLTSGQRGAPGEGRMTSILPTTDDVLRGTHPTRLRQLAQKLLLTEGLRERIGLGVGYGAAIVDGWWRSRSEDQR